MPESEAKCWCDHSEGQHKQGICVRCARWELKAHPSTGCPATRSTLGRRRPHPPYGLPPTRFRPQSTQGRFIQPTSRYWPDHFRWVLISSGIPRSSLAPLGRGVAGEMHSCQNLFAISCPLKTQVD
jgi:hypothetical protein